MHCSRSRINVPAMGDGHAAETKTLRLARENGSKIVVFRTMNFRYTENDLRPVSK
jgi:hypothetical protein